MKFHHHPPPHHHHKPNPNQTHRLQFQHKAAYSQKGRHMNLDMKMSLLGPIQDYPIWEIIDCSKRKETRKARNHLAYGPSQKIYLVNCPRLDHEALEQIDEYDLEEMDLKWKVAMDLNVNEKFYKRTGHFARECRIKGNQENRRRDAWNSRNKDGSRTGQKEDSKALVLLMERTGGLVYHSDDEISFDGCALQQLRLRTQRAYSQGLKESCSTVFVASSTRQLWYEQKIKFMKIDLDDKTDVLTYHKKLLAEAQKEKEDLKAKVEKWHNSSKNLGKLLNTQMSANDKFGLGYGDHRYDGILSYENEVLQSVFMNKKSEIENQHLYDRFVTVEGMHAVPPPMTGNFMAFRDLMLEVDDSIVYIYGPKQTQNLVCLYAPIIEEYESDSDDECVVIPTKQQETPSFANKQVKTPRENVKRKSDEGVAGKSDEGFLVGYSLQSKAFRFRESSYPSCRGVNMKANKMMVTEEPTEGMMGKMEALNEKNEGTEEHIGGKDLWQIDSCEKLQEQKESRFTIEEIQALYEKIKRSDEDFISIGSAEDERLIKRMNEKGVDLSKSEVIKEESKEEVQKMAIANGNFRLFKLISWRVGLKIMMESSTEGNEQSEFMDVVNKIGKILVERRYPLSKDLLQKMLDLGLEVERESSVALDLIRVNYPEQTATGKGTSNPLMADSLPKNYKANLVGLLLKRCCCVAEKTKLLLKKDRSLKDQEMLCRFGLHLYALKKFEET
ncbi:hypothetical protein Tco_0787616 [Tanacetum coccineum]